VPGAIFIIWLSVLVALVALPVLTMLAAVVVLVAFLKAPQLLPLPPHLL
jgi:hypothetical protein